MLIVSILSWDLDRERTEVNEALPALSTEVDLDLVAAAHASAAL